MRFLKSRQLQQQQEEEDVTGQIYDVTASSFSYIFFQTIARQFAALSSIGFAVGSQKVCMYKFAHASNTTVQSPNEMFPIYYTLLIRVLYILYSCY